MTRSQFFERLDIQDNFQDIELKELAIRGLINNFNLSDSHSKYSVSLRIDNGENDITIQKDVDGVSSICSISNFISFIRYNCNHIK